MLFVLFCCFPLLLMGRYRLPRYRIKRPSLPREQDGISGSTSYSQCDALYAYSVTGIPSSCYPITIALSHEDRPSEPNKYCIFYQ